LTPNRRNRSHGRGAVIVFAKAPRVGFVKTRMVPPLSGDQAAELYGHMLDDVLAATAHLADTLGLDAHLCVYPEDGCRELLPRTPSSYRVFAQRGRDLAERMTWAIAEVSAGGASPVLVRGSDSPALSRVHFEAVLDALRHDDVAICPDLDGGYNMVGVREPAPGLFAHPMSTGSVLEDTLACARGLELRCTVTPPCFDLDTPADFAALAAARREGATAGCPRTLAFLDQGELWHLAESG
jgi:rSAM/selenodomain-associated transferase 1